MKQKYLSDIELYYSDSIKDEIIELTGDEQKHITKVMRHSVGDLLHITDGRGNYYESIISKIEQGTVLAGITKKKSYLNRFENIFFCFPRLKSNDRFSFELEKAVELGITNFIIVNTERTIPKGEKLERWNKIALAAMKQSLRTYIPKIEYLNSFDKLNTFKGEKIILEQKGEESLISYLKNLEEDKKYYFIFGPEGGLSEKEMKLLDNIKLLSLTENRLRAETAVIATATAISLL